MFSSERSRKTSRKIFLEESTAALLSLFLFGRSSFEKYHIPTASEIQGQLKSIEFWTQPRFNGEIFTRQFDQAQYDPPTWMNNSCGQAVIATILKAYAYLQFGSVPDITIQSVRDNLASNSYIAAGKAHEYILWDSEMDLTGVEAALKLYSNQFSIEIKSFPDIAVQGYDDNGINYSRLMTSEQVASLISQAQNVFAQGGLLVILTPTYNEHFTIVSDLYANQSGHIQSFVIDSFGPRDTHTGIIGPMSLETYNGSTNGYTGLMSAIGVIPTFASF